MLEKLSEIKQRYDSLNQQISDPEVISDNARFRTLTKEQAGLTEIVAAYDAYQQLLAELKSNRELERDPKEDSEIREMAREEIERLEEEVSQKEADLRMLLLPKDPDDDRNIILEIRAGTGGDEAALFARDLYRMYVRFAEINRWRTTLISESQTDIGGFKEVILSISGENVFSKLKYEAGVHRVQRVPKTETQGRVHTSAATVAVMPEVEEVEVEINPNDLRVDVYRSSGPGGQSVNTTDSAVRLTHLPTGLVVICQNEKSQLKNKAAALKVLRARLYEIEQAAQMDETAKQRRSMVGSGDRSERIRTYNFPQGRLSDHRINLTLYQLEDIMLGNLTAVVEALQSHHRAELLKSGGVAA